MKKYILSFAFAICTLTLVAQSRKSNPEIKIGDVFEIGKSETNAYQYINLPKPNFIIKRGGIASYKDIEGSIVVVTSLKKKRDGTTVITIKRINGNRFFGSHNTLTANFNAALQSGELKVK